MARLYGKNVTVMQLDTTDHDLLLSFQEIMVEETADTIPSEAVKDTVGNFGVGLKSWTASVRGAYDDDLILPTPGEEVALAFTDNTAGRAYTGTAIVSKRSHTAGDAQTYDIGLTGVGALLIDGA